jgi:hypothetical protein
MGMKVIFYLTEIETVWEQSATDDIEIEDRGSKWRMGKITHDKLNYLHSAVLGNASAGG